MKKNLIFLLAALALSGLSACTSESRDEAGDTPVVSFTAFADTGTEVVQANMRTDAPEPELISVSGEFNLEFLQNGRNQVDTASIAYYTWEGQESRVYYKDLESGEVFTQMDVCGFSTETDFPKSVRSIWGNGDYVVMAYNLFSGAGMPETRLRVLDRAAGTCRDLLLTENAGQDQINMLFSGDLLIVYFTDSGSGLPLLRLVNLAAGSLVTSLNLTDNFVAAALRGEQLLLFGRDQSFETFNTGSLTFGDMGNTPGFPILSQGLFRTRFSGDLVLVSYIYQQPSLFFSQPALYDLTTGSYAAGGEPFLPLLQARIERETGNRFLFGNFDADPDSGLILIAYVQGDGSPQGGVVLTDFEANPLQIIPLPIVPEQIVLRDIIR
ncbi:hypothetical protein [Robiginitalea sp. SC105]|uniref:hypothetical protein n=1 Tax=Robiginitalea sp. SC105 TaxID=2762332 RepID=UPI00163B01FC|nr:hypothetical protein [Robiginitalea sp. SC105]MBC2839708.1 hypothetical protein [Robiginitalea sp. SC105]